MGYYSTIEFNVKVKKDKIKDCAIFIEKRVRELSSGYVLWHLRNITEIDKNGNITFATNYSKWYYEVNFLCELLPFLDNGQVIFKGEGSETWGYDIFNGKLHWFSVEYRRAEKIRA